ncbi:efflux RND transporter periplasmic adaptor subunit [Aliikangiella maris]|uniref:Efflux RND transporter periplasmic adaptor subunit n=2 Tax=Aliikangiella maris TaxID=3162458 RepID=A0ABV3MPU2_9GAMM
MKLFAANSTERLKMTFLSIMLGLSVLTTACSDSGQSDDQKQASQDDKSKQAKDEKASGDDGKAKQKEKAPVPVEVVSVSRGEIKQTYRTITTLEAESDAQVVARSSGLLQKLLVEEGDLVKKGELLAQLDIEQLSLEVAQMEATSNKLKKELDRQQTLFNRKLGSSDALDRAKFEYQSQQAQFQLAKLKLRYASIKAPIDGVITERNVKIGNFVRESDILFKIVDPQSLKAVLHLPEREMSNVKKGQDILLKVDAYAENTIVGKIERIRPSIDTSTGTFKVVAKLNNLNNQLKPGMFGKVEVVFNVHADSLLLEQQAIITQDNRSHVFVVEDNIAKRIAIETGFKHNGIVEIVSGLNDNSQVITTGQQILKHDTKVEIVASENVVDKNKAEKSTSVSNVAVNH